MKHCVYHRIDYDGVCSAAIVRHKHPDVKLYGMDYYDSFDFTQFEDGDEVVIVDFSFPAIDMQILADRCKLTWIDHHKTAIKDNAHLKLWGIQQQGRAGCELTWNYFYPKTPMPHAVRLLGRYDIWDHDDPDVIPFQLGMRAHGFYNPTDSVWKQLLKITSSLVVNIIQDGQVILPTIPLSNE